MVTALLADPPIQTTRRLARTCGVKPARMQYCFRVGTHGTSPKELLQWALMPHIALRRPFGLSWEWLARELKTSVQRLRRATMRSLAATPSAAEKNHGAAARRAFDDYLVQAFKVDAGAAPPIPGTSDALGA